MFLRKIFTSNNKFAWAFIDLIIVIIGVYSAFLIQSRAASVKDRKEQVRVLTALKFELEVFKFRMFETALGMKGLEQDLIKIGTNDTYSDFSNFRFIEPQYDYQTIDYGIRLQNTDVVDFQLYDVLQSLFVEIKKMEHAERLITETSRRYKSIPKGKENGDVFQLAHLENKDNYQRFITLIGDRGSIADRISKASAEAVPLINARLGEKRAREIERQIILENIDRARNEDEAVFLANQFFPAFSEQEVRQLYKEAKKKGD